MKPGLTSVTSPHWQVNAETGKREGDEAPAFWIRYDADQQGRRLSFLQAWLVDGERGFVLSYTGQGEEFGAFRPDAEAIFRTFRLT